MALQINHTTAAGLTAPECYVRICRFWGDKASCHLTLLYYATKAARDAEQPYITSKTYEASIVEDDGHPLPAGYAWLKANVAEFENAVDV